VTNKTALETGKVVLTKAQTVEKVPTEGRVSLCIPLFSAQLPT